MSFIARIRERARSNPRRIVLPEATDERILEAAIWLAREGMARPILLGAPEIIPPPVLAEPGVSAVDPARDPRLEKLAAHLWNRRKKRGMTEVEALRRAAEPLLFGALLVATGEADGSVAGVAHATCDVLRAALWAIGAAEGISTVSSSFYMVVRKPGSRSETVLTFTDPAVVPDPNPFQLAEIALAASEARVRVVGDEPRVAFLSYSTHGSAEGPSVEKVREAVAIFRARAPEIAADGELQVDAALVESVAHHKLPDSPVAGRANILVFPDLDAANIGYKLVQRLAGAEAIGPIVQGLARPCSDLSRGADVEDVVNVACITGLMSD